MEVTIEAKELGEFLIRGQIKTFSEYEDIKEAIEDHLAQDAEELILHIEESKTIISSFIGFLIKQVNQQKKVQIFVSEEPLYKTFSDLGLVQAFNVQKSS